MENQANMSVQSLNQNKREELISSYQNKSMHLSPSKIKAFYEGGPKGLLDYSLVDKGLKTIYNEGNAIELKLMAPDDFENAILIMDPNSRPDTNVGMTGKKNQAWKKELILKADTEGKIYLEKEALDKINATAKELKNNIFIQKHFEMINEIQTKVEFDLFGWKILGYLDGLGQIIFDLKYSSTKTSVSKTIQQFWKLKYWLPATIYHHGIKQLDGRDLPVIYGTIDQNKSYFPFEIDPNILTWGMGKIETTINNLERCIKDDLWHMGEEFFFMGSNSHTIPLMLPEWAKQKM